MSLLILFVLPRVLQSTPSFSFAKSSSVLKAQPTCLCSQAGRQQPCWPLPWFMCLMVEPVSCCHAQTRLQTSRGLQVDLPKDCWPWEAAGSNARNTLGAWGRWLPFYIHREKCSLGRFVSRPRQARGSRKQVTRLMACDVQSSVFPGVFQEGITSHA